MSAKEEPTDATETSPLDTIITLITTYPVPFITLALLATFTLYIYPRYQREQALQGQPTRTLGTIINDHINLTYKEPSAPLLTRPTWAQEITWKHLFTLGTLGTLATLTITPTHLPLPATLTIAATSATALTAAILHNRKTLATRNQIVMQMFEVAAAECRYPREAALAPHAWVAVTSWDNNTPGPTYIHYPPRYRSEDPKNRAAFEANFNGTVSATHTWTYEWESAYNRVLARPTPFIPERAPYPGTDTHAWNEFPLGLGAGGKVITWSSGEFPHVLVAGSTGSGKALEALTSIPTPTGWTTFQDVRPGDTVFDEHGKPCTVTWISDISNLDLYAVHFSDGTVIEADADHLWFTETRAARVSRFRQKAHNEARERRPLISPRNAEALRKWASGKGPDDQCTLTEIAQIAGVRETTPWFREIADELGHAGETQLVVDFHYAEQQVVQQQKMRFVSAADVWAAFAAYEPVLAWWAEFLPVFVERAARVKPGEELSSRELAEVLGTTPKRAALALKKVPRLRREGAAANAVTYWDAETAWCSLRDRASERPHWWHLRDKCAELARNANPGEEVSFSEIADVLGMDGPVAVAGWVQRFGMPVVTRKSSVVLDVPAKTVRRKGIVARTYLATELAQRLLDRNATPAHDQQHKRARGSVKTTLEILQTLRTPSGHANHSIPVSHPIQMPHASLPVPPYTLGAWLGDGSSRQPEICGIDHEVARNCESEGITDLIPRMAPEATPHPDFRIWKSEQLRTLLRSEGLLQRHSDPKSRKHIPVAYLRASIEQRRALLAGLLDTDGTVSPQGTVQLSNTNRRLADGVLELARSLGYRASLTSSVKRAQTGAGVEAFTVSWTCVESPFWLARKTAAHRERNVVFSAERNEVRYITDVVKVESKPGRCIAVDSPSRLFLAGDAMVPTHNSVTQRTILMHAFQSPMWRILLADPKRVELSPYKEYPNVIRVETELADMLDMVERLSDEMDFRYKTMEQEGVNFFLNLKEPPPALLLMVDEVFALLAPSKIKSEEGKEMDGMKDRCNTLIGNIARLGRAAGIHMVLCTQRPDAVVLPGETKANLECRVAQGRMDTIPSQMTLDSDAATRIPPVKGRAVCRQGNAFEEFQAYFLEPDQIPAVLALAVAEHGDDGDAVARARAEAAGVDVHAGESRRGQVGLLGRWLIRREKRIKALEHQRRDFAAGNRYAHKSEERAQRQERKRQRRKKQENKTRNEKGQRRSSSGSGSGILGRLGGAAGKLWGSLARAGAARVPGIGGRLRGGSTDRGEGGLSASEQWTQGSAGLSRGDPTRIGFTDPHSGRLDGEPELVLFDEVSEPEGDPLLHQPLSTEAPEVGERDMPPPSDAIWEAVERARQEVIEADNTSVGAVQLKQYLQQDGNTSHGTETQNSAPEVANGSQMKAYASETSEVSPDVTADDAAEVEPQAPKGRTVPVKGGWDVRETLPPPVEHPNNFALDDPSDPPWEAR